MDRFEYLGMLGLFGMVLTSISTTDFIESLLVNPHNRWSLALWFFVYVASVCRYYVSCFGKILGVLRRHSLEPFVAIGQSWCMGIHSANKHAGFAPLTYVLCCTGLGCGWCMSLRDCSL